MTTFQQSRKEDMADFFREPNRERLREILRGHDGEYDNLDFKQEWIDHAKLAKHVLAIANSGGGVIIFGVSEGEDNTLSINGLDKLKDKADIAIDQYLPGDAKDIYEIEDFEYSSSDWEKLEDKLFQVLFIDDVPGLLPLVAQKSAKGRIKQNSIYVRRNTKSVEADQSDLDNLINRRVRIQLDQESGDLREELSELQALYDFASEDKPRITSEAGGKFPTSFKHRLLPGRRQDFYRFIERKISEKEERIEERLGLR